MILPELFFPNVDILKLLKNNNLYLLLNIGND